jgi:peptidoglycan hydrolase CwlO-like protein
MAVGKIIKVGLKALKKKKKPPVSGPPTKVKSIDNKINKLKVEKRKANKPIGRRYKTITQRKRNIKGAKMNIKNIDEHINRLKSQRKDLLRKK